MKPVDILLAISVAVIWGMGFTFAKAAIAHFPPILLMALSEPLDGLRSLVFVTFEQVFDNSVIEDLTVALEYLDLDVAIVHELHLPVLAGHIDGHHDSPFADAGQGVLDFRRIETVQQVGQLR